MVQQTRIPRGPRETLEDVYIFFKILSAQDGGPGLWAWRVVARLRSGRRVPVGQPAGAGAGLPALEPGPPRRRPAVDQAALPRHLQPVPRHRPVGGAARAAALGPFRQHAARRRTPGKKKTKQNKTAIFFLVPRLAYWGFFPVSINCW